MKTGLFFSLLLSLAPVLRAEAQNADPFRGPHQTMSAEYRRGPGFDPEVLAEARTEVLAKLYRPALGSAPVPLIVILHGNHETCENSETGALTCEYTFTGQCTGQGNHPVYNHLGYDYLADRLASWGFFVVSVNADLGISCASGGSEDFGLNLARGKLVLRHLAILNQWNKTGTLPDGVITDPRNPIVFQNIRGRIDLSRVGLLGHSRGGEGVRAAYNLYRDPQSSWPSQIPGLRIPAIYEIAPVDGQTSRTLNPDGAAWNVLLPMCDGDVVSLEGMKPYDRMMQATQEFPPSPKSMFAVWGANHNYFNSKWTQNDSEGCVGQTPLWDATGSMANQQQFAIQSVIPFFRAYLGDTATLDSQLPFNPVSPLAASFTSKVDRSYTITPNERYVVPLENFKSGDGMGLYGTPHDTNNIQVVHETVHEHDESHRAARITWQNAGADTFFQNNWTAPGKGVDFAGYATLDFRVSRTATSPNSEETTEFQIQAVDANGNLGPPVDLSSYLVLEGPVGSVQSPHETLETVRIPLDDLGASRSFVRGVRFTFNRTPTGEIHVSDITLSRFLYATGGRHAVPRPGPGRDWPRIPRGRAVPRANMTWAAPAQAGAAAPLRATQRIVRASAATASRPWAELEVESDRPLPVGNALPKIEINGVAMGVGAIAYPGNPRSQVFKIKQEHIENLPATFELKIRYRGRTWDFGRVSSSIFR